MDGPGRQADRERAERQWRVTVAFVESAIATSAALDALVTRLYRRDPDALSHLHRVALLAIRIGTELGLAGRVLDDLERAALVHDVGRFVAPDPVEVPPGRPERVAMAARAEQVRTASEIAGTVPFLKPAAAIVGSSLECFDGSGVPHGLKGDAIPLASRVLHVADTLDALTSMCVSLACSPEVANTELVRLAGCRFDPDVVAAWLRCSDDAPPLAVAQWPQAERMN